MNLIKIIEKNLEESSDTSTDEGEITGSPKRLKTPKTRNLPLDNDTILSTSIRSASYNMIFQVFTRFFTFGINAFILRHVSHGFLGICNVRLALLYSSIAFLSREPFRRAVLRKESSHSWKEAINLIWLSIPLTILWSLVLGYIWINALSQPEEKMEFEYSFGVIAICISSVIESLAETPYIIGQYFLYYKLRIAADSSLIAIRALFLCVGVLFYPQHVIVAYGLGTLAGVIFVLLIYYGFFAYILSKKNHLLPFDSIKDFVPSFNTRIEFPKESGSLAYAFFKQGILKQLLTEGERYMMTVFDLLTFEEQGVYDLVSNLGSIAARFIFLPIEESAYFYFAQTLQRKATFSHRENKLAKDSGMVLGNLVRLILIIGFIGIVYGIPYSNTVLFFYGGPNLSEQGPATLLLQANCAYILIMALNGVTETFTFAAMTQTEMDKFNKRLVIFSAIFLFASYVFTKMFGSVGFYLANSLNMGLRVLQSMYLIRKVFISCDFTPFEYWIPPREIIASFVSAFTLIILSKILLGLGRFPHLALGLIMFGLNMFAVLKFERGLIQFFTTMFKKKIA